MIRPPLRSRPGVTLLELLVSMVIATLIGAAVVRGIVTETLVGEDREAWANARRVAQSAYGLLVNELRMVETGAGVEYANDDGDSLIVRVPYAFGVLCATDGSVSTLALLPTDSVMLAAPGFSGFAWRNSIGGTYSYVLADTDLRLDGDPKECEENGIAPIEGLEDSPDGLVVEVEGEVPGDIAPGTVFFLFRRVLYEFADSDLVPGSIGLWKTLLETGSAEELAAPFDTTARFAYYVPGSNEPTEDAPEDPSDIRGIEIRLDARSERTPRVSTSGPRTVRYATAIFFQNISD